MKQPAMRDEFQLCGARVQGPEIPRRERWLIWAALAGWLISLALLAGALS